MYNSIHGVSVTFTPIGRYEKCPAGTYKVALVVSGNDYHRYRQDADGLWSHKRGTNPVKRTDESGELIIDPMLANRDSYTTFVGYFAVKPWNNMYNSSATSIPKVNEQEIKEVDIEDVKKLDIGMSLTQVISLVGDGIDIGSGTCIFQYQIRTGETYTIFFASIEGEFYVASIEIERCESK